MRPNEKEKQQLERRGSFNHSHTGEDGHGNKIDWQTQHKDAKRTDHLEKSGSEIERYELQSIRQFDDRMSTLCRHRLERR